MNSFKKIAVWLFIFASFISFILFGFDVILPSSLDETIKNSHRIKIAFSETASLVEDYEKENHQFPTNEKLQAILKEHNSEITELMSINSDLGEQPKFLREDPGNSYYLTYWRGEWAEYYAGWSKQSTLVFDKERFYPFNSQNLTLLASFLSLLAVGFGFFLKNYLARQP